MRYRFIGETPSVLGDFSHGRNATVTRADADAPPDKPGSTVVMFPGDIIDTTDEIISGLLELDGDAPVGKMRKPELVDALAELGLDTSGSVRELRARLAEAAEHGSDELASEPGDENSAPESDDDEHESDDGESAVENTPETEGDPT